MDHATLGKVTVPGPPLRFFTTEDQRETTRREHTAPPVLDADGPAIRDWIANDTPASG